MPQIKSNKPRYNPWMLYAVIILIIIAISYSTNGSGNSKQISLSKFYNLLDENKVEKVVFNKNSARIYLNKEAKEAEKNTKENLPNFLGRENNGPQYTVDVASPDLFQKKLDEAHAEGKLKEYGS